MTTIDRVQFGALTDDEWRVYSAAHITTPVNRGNSDTTNTPYDIRLGALENGAGCGTCGKTNNQCPGHFGHIELYEPIYNPVYISIVLGLIKCICIKCHAPRIPKNSAENIQSHKKSRFNAYRKKAEILKQCTSCRHPLPSFFIEKYGIKMFFDDKKKATPISAREMKAILVQITSETMELLGFNEDLDSQFIDQNIDFPTPKTHIHEVRPESFILGVLPVLPTCARPWIVRDGERKDDDITDAYNSILKINNKLLNDEMTTRGTKKRGPLSDATRKKLIDDLTCSIWTLMDNSKDKAKNNARQIKGITNRLKGKDGHFQYNVGGKRVDFSARTPIIPGGSIVPMGWIGIPQDIADVLTIPELVLGWNMKEMVALLEEDKIKCIFRQGRSIPISDITGRGRDFTWNGEKGLKKYDIIHRKLRNGDWGIFNRQPTLRIESMQGVQVMILPPDEMAFRIPLGMTRAFNADCDGDEMNLHIAQSQAGRVECSTISRTAFQMVSAQNCAPIMGCVQNTLLCNYLLTETFTTPETTKPNAKPNYIFEDGTQGYQTLISVEDFIAANKVGRISDERYEDLLSRAYEFYPKYIKFKGGRYSPKKRIPGKIVASIVFPRTFTWSRKTDVNDKLPEVKIIKGIIHPDSGPVCKKIIGGCSGSAIHYLWKISPDVSMNVITELQFMTTVLITRIGFSMGISDCIPLKKDEIQKAVAEALIKCELINDSSKDEQEKEIEINSALNEAMSVAPKLAKTSMNKGDRNALVVQKKSGAKGSDVNNWQISGFVGPQSIDGKRMPLTLGDNTRGLPHFKHNDNSPEARGFIKSSFLDGLNYKETWFHAAAGRRGVVDTAMKSVTGDTKIMIEEQGSLKVVKIGPWIDELLSRNSPTITEPKRNMKTLFLDAEVLIPTVDELCSVTWGLVTAVTRHDPTEVLYKVKTRLGREVTVTDSKSLLTYNFVNEKLEQTFMKDVKVGYLVPVTRNLPERSEEPPKGVFEFDLARVNMKSYNTLIYNVENDGGDPDKILIIPDSQVKIKGDVILDEIVSIEICKDKHQYVYDLTVPSTTNFCLANGLHVVDTADSGYIQKKIVKKIEDCKVHHDGTIRDANGCILEFAYGGDGLNAKELIQTGLKQPFFINLKFVADQLNSEAELMKRDKNTDIGTLRSLKKDEVNLLVSFIQSGIPGTQTEVTERVTFNTKTIIRSQLPKIKIYEYMIPVFCRKIKDEYEEAKAKMGYMAGLVAASSMGEPTTQLSVEKNERIILMIKYKSGEIKYYNRPIGKMVNFILKNLCSDVFELDIANGKSEVGVPDPDIANIYVNTVNPKTSKTEWKKLQEVSKHPANGKLVKVTTKSGRQVTTTLSHSHLKRDPKTGNIVPIRGDELEIGHFIPVCGKLNTEVSIKNISIQGKVYPLDFDMGWIFGAYLAEGYINNGQICITNISEHFKNRCASFAKKYGGKIRISTKTGHIEGSKKIYKSETTHISGLSDLGRYIAKKCGSGSKNKHVPAFSHFSPLNFVSGLLRGYFDGDGNINKERHIIRVHSISKNLIETVGLLLLRFGIFGTVSIEKKERINPLFCYKILKKYAETFLVNIGTDFPDKLNSLEYIVDHNNRDNVHSQREDIDLIPEIGINISLAAKPLKLAGYSRNYKRHEKKPYIGRETLKKYIETFELASEELQVESKKDMKLLRKAADADIIWDQIVDLEILKDPKDVVYDLGVTGNHTFALQTGIYTHNTLNSLDWKEIIYVRRGDKVIIEPIGKFIDRIIDTTREKRIQRLPNEQIYIDIAKKGYYVTSVDEDGKMHWKLLEAVTRHLPGGKLIKVKTQTGREVVATKGHSFLTRKKNKITSTLGSELKEGDRVPIMFKYPKVREVLSSLDVKQYLSPTEYIYTSEMKKAWVERSKGVKGWFKQNGQTFTIPYNRSDSFYVAYNRSVSCENPKFKDKCVYPKLSCSVVSEIPENMTLDHLTGFLFGAYIAEGCVTKTFVCISNPNPGFRNKIYQWCDRYKIGHHTVKKESERFENALTTDIKIHSTMLAKILGDSCGRGSSNKKIPEWSLIASKKFIKGLLNGYFSGDGTVEKRSGNVKCSSASHILILGICELLSKFGIYGSISSIQNKSNNIGSTDIKPSFVLDIRGVYANLFAEKIGSVVKDKQDRLENITLKKERHYGGYGRFAKIPIFYKGKEREFGPEEIHKKLEEAADKILEDALNQDVFYDSIISIEEVECSTRWVYDFTVADTKNFATFGGFQVRDTFHNTGQSAKDVTLGVPRLKEILNTTKKPSKPSCTVYLKDRKLERLATKGDDTETLKRAADLSNNFTERSADYFIDKIEMKYLKKHPKTSPIDTFKYEKYVPEWWVKISSTFVAEPDFDPKVWMLELHLNLDRLYQYSLTLKELASKIEEIYGDRYKVFSCVVSPLCIGRVDIYINFTEINEHVVSKFEDLGFGKDVKPLLTPKNIDYFTVRDVAMNLIRKTPIIGIKGITKTYVRQIKDTKEWVLDTQGTNLLEILSFKGVDTTRTISDDMWEIYRIFGIEATRKFLVEEITKILSFDGTYINPRHICLLVDSICKTGAITSVNRDGISRDVGPLAKGMFEKAVDNFAESAAFAEYDIMRGVSASVMMGTVPKVGTGTVEIKVGDRLG